MRVTRLGPTRPLLNSGRIGQPGGVPTGGSADQVLTATGSNSGTYWGENVKRISAHGSNILGPYVNFAAGSNTTLTIDQGPGGSMPSNTIRIHGAAGGVTGITANGSNSLAGAVNLQAGTGIALGVAAQTITVINTGVPGPAGGGGGGGRGEYASKYNPDHETPATTPADAEEFNTIKGMAWDSAPATDDLATYPGYLRFKGTVTERHLSKAWTPGAVDVTIACKFADSASATDTGSVGLYVGDATGNPANGVYVIFELTSSGHTKVSLYNENASTFALLSAVQLNPGLNRTKQDIYLRLTRLASGPTWTGYASYDGITWFAIATTGSKALTIGAFGLRIESTHDIALDWVRVWTSVVEKVGA